MFVNYAPETGAVTGLTFTAPEGFREHLVEMGATFIEVAGNEVNALYYTQKCFVRDGKLMVRPVFDAPDVIEIDADGVNTATILLPTPCDITIDGEPHTIMDGELVLQSDMEADYDVQLVQWPYIQKQIKVTARAAQ